MEQARLTYLISKIADEGSEAAFEELHQFYFCGLLSFGVSILKDQHLAEEVIEDVFINMWLNRKTLPTVKSLSNYLYISVKHACLNTLKSRRFNSAVKKTILGEVGEEHYSFILHSPEELLISNQNLKIISAAIDTLPPKCRLVFRLIKEEGLKYKEVAELLNISVKTVQHHLCKALALVIEKLRQLSPEYFIKYGAQPGLLTSVTEKKVQSK